MYCEFYQLSERPFNITPDPKFLYLNARYREAIASLKYGITQRKGFITLIGEAGTGKTTLLKRLLEDLDPKTRTVFIFNTNVTFEEILEYIFAEFDLPVLNGKKLYMLQRLNAFLLEELRNGGNVALLIDEAQDLEFSVLEDLRLLSNLETAKEKILQIVLSGQPELGQKVSNPALRQLRQRIGINCRLPPLSRDEVSEYIQYRLEATHCPDLKLFSREAEDQIYRFSRGIPRLVNVVSDNALVIGYALGRKRIDADLVAEAAADLLSVEPQLGDFKEQPIAVTTAPVPERLRSPWPARFGVSAIVLVVGLLGLLSVGRTMLNKHDEEQLAEAPTPTVRLEVIRPGSEPRGTGIAPPAVPASGTIEAPGPPEGVIAKLPEAAAAVPVSALPAAAPVESHEKSAERREGHEGREEQLVALPKKELALPKEEVVIPKPKEVGSKAAVLPKQQQVVPSKQQEVGLPTQKEVVPKQAALPKPREVAAPKLEGEATSTASIPGGSSPHLDGVQLAPVEAHAGDSISAIALREYGQASYTILDLLKLANPELQDLDAIAVGQTIRLPSLAEGFPILSDGSGQYALLVFSTPEQRRATAMQTALRGHGFQTRVTAGSSGLGVPLYRLVIGGFTERDAAVGVGKQVQKTFREDKRLARLGVSGVK